MSPARPGWSLCAVALLVSATACSAPIPTSTDTRAALPGSTTPWALTAAPVAATATDPDHDPDAATVSAHVLLAAGSAPADVARVSSWLTEHDLDVTRVRESIDVVSVAGTRAALADAFTTSFVTTDRRGLTATAPNEPLQVPAALGDVVVGVAGLVDADAARPATSAGALPHVTEECALHWGEKFADEWPATPVFEHRSNSLCGYGPAELRAIHELPEGATGEGSTIAVVAAYDDPTVEANTNAYFEAVGAQPFRPGQYTHHAPAAPDVDRCGGPSSWTAEQHLDVQAVHAIAPDADVAYWGADDCTTVSLYLRVLDAVEGSDPDVVSLSFGAPEELDSDDDRVLLGRVLAEAASRGVSVFASSGNEGDFSLAGDHHGHTDVASPASHPLVTSVGGTSVGLDAEGAIVVEAGWEIQTRFARSGTIVPPGFLHGAGGGESEYYDRPTWQREHLADVAGSGRLVPDVASLADPHTGFVVLSPVGGEPVYAPHGGTSLATPMVAATVAVAKAETGVDVGVAAPFLYDLAGTDAIRDVTPASAAIWHRRDASTGALWLETLHVWDANPQGLQSAPGWDPVTGVGVPRGQAFLSTFGADR